MFGNFHVAAYRTCSKMVSGFGPGGDSLHYTLERVTLIVAEDRAPVQSALKARFRLAGRLAG